MYHYNYKIMDKSSRQKWIDNAKGIALICVIIGHINAGKIGEYLDFSFVYGFHLIVFCLLSGFTLKKKELNSTFVNSLFQKLMVPYFVTCACIMLMDLWNHLFFEHDGNIITLTGIVSKDLLRSFFASGTIMQFGTVEIGSRIGAIWWLPAIFFAVLIMQILLSFTDDRLRLGVSTSILAMLGNISAQFIWFPFSIQSAMEMAFFIWIGYEIKRSNLLERVSGRWYVVAALIFLLWAVRFKYSTIYVVTAHINDMILSVIVALAECLLVYGLAVNIKRFNGFAYVGEHSLIFLCVHLFALETIWRYFRAFTVRILHQEVGTWSFYRWMLILNLLFALIIGTMIVEGRRYLANRYNIVKDSTVSAGRDRSVDILRGILIVSMLIGHNQIDPLLRKTIYSCHMIAFVFLSGLYYKRKEDMKAAVLHVIRTFMVPYGVFFVLDLVLHIHKAGIILTKNIIGISFAKNILTEVHSVGPVYFILILFVVRVIYILIDHFIRHPIYKSLAVILISWVGMKVGQKGYWLPWSLDVTCYCLIFYYIGALCREHGFIEWVKKQHLLYFALSPIWVYMIYKGSMEIAVRNYGSQYGLTIIGALCGTLLVYKLSVFIDDYMGYVSTVLSALGACTVYILIFHTIFNGVVSKYVAMRFGLGYAFHFTLTICLQLFAGWVVYRVVQYLKTFRMARDER